MGAIGIGKLLICITPQQQNIDARAAQNICTIAARIRIILSLGTLYLLVNNITHGRRKCKVRVACYATDQHKNH